MHSVVSILVLFLWWTLTDHAAATTTIAMREDWLVRRMQPTSDTLGQVRQRDRQSPEESEEPAAQRQRHAPGLAHPGPHALLPDQTVPHPASGMRLPATRDAAVQTQPEETRSVQELLQLDTLRRKCTCCSRSSLQPCTSGNCPFPFSNVADSQPDQARQECPRMCA